MPIFGLMIILLIFQNTKILKLFSFITPLISAYTISIILIPIRFIDPPRNAFDPGIPHTSSFLNEMPTHTLGLLFSPGIGLFIFAPLLITIFMSFLDFYQKNKKFCLLFIVITISFMLLYSRLE